MTFEILSTTPKHAVAHLVLAHGAGAPMDSDFMELITHELTVRAIAVSRFEFDYMAERRLEDGRRRPPPRIDKLIIEYANIFHHIRKTMPSDRPLLIGGKSMGGRVASMIADTLYGTGDISGLICLGYPFHPANKPNSLRTAHLEALQCPTLILQGDRDKLGNQSDVSGYALSKKISIHWLTDGDHDFKPRKSSGTTQKENLMDTADAIAAFASAL